LALDVQLGVSPASWMSDELPWLGAETPVPVALSEARRIGYQGIELSGRFPQDPAALRDLLATHGLACAAGRYDGQLSARPVEEELPGALAQLPLLEAGGARVLLYGEARGSIRARAEVPFFKRPCLRGDDAWRTFGERLTALARQLLARGVRLACRHQVGTCLEAAEDVDRLVKATGPEVGLALDTAQASLGGADPLELLERHGDRVCHVHLSDLRPAVVRMARNCRWSYPQAVLRGALTVPGDGALDFSRLLAALDRLGYRGWLVVEAAQDPAVAPAHAFAEKGFRHVQDLLGQLGARPREAA